MNIYTYSEARQKLANVLDNAEASGKVLIQRKDGSVFSLTPEQAPVSPLDVPSIRVDVTTKEIVDIVRKERSRTRGWKRRGKPRAST